MLTGRKPALLAAVAAFALGVVSSTSALAQDGRSTQGYLIDQRNGIVKDPFNLCWRTGYWTPALANCECDSSLLPRDVCFPPPPKPAAAPPPPPPPPAAAPKPVTEKVTFAADVLFDFDKAVLKPEGKAKLDDLVSKLKGVALEVIIAIGHTDPIGSAEYNHEAVGPPGRGHQGLSGEQGHRAEPDLHRRQGPDAADQEVRRGATSRRGRQYVECLPPNRRVEVEVVGTRTK